MIQIISYEVKNKILTVGFKVDNFVVYSNIPSDDSKTRQQLLQLAYEPIKQAIDYEKTLTSHAITTDKTGEAFTPEESKLKSLKLLLDEQSVQFEGGQEDCAITPTVLAVDQYGDVIDIDVQYTTNYGSIQNGLITLPKVDKATEAKIVATVGNITDEKILHLYPYVEKFENIVVDLINNVKDKQNILENNQVSVLDQYNSIEGKVQEVESNQNSIFSSQEVIFNDSAETFDYLLDYEFRLSMLELGL